LYIEDTIAIQKLHGMGRYRIGLKTSILSFGDEEILQPFRRFGENVHLYLQHEMSENVLKLQLFLIYS
jgi:hypothetical protein